MTLTSTFGPVPSHSSLYSPGFRVVPLTTVGFLISRLPLDAANALEANNTANPITKLFETVVNFIAAPFSFPKSRRETAGGGPVHDHMRKHLCFLTNRLTMLPLGLRRQVSSLLFHHWGFPHLGRQTEYEKIP